MRRSSIPTSFLTEKTTKPSGKKDHFPTDDGYRKRIRSGEKLADGLMSQGAAGRADNCADQSAPHSMTGVHVTDHGHAYQLGATRGRRPVLRPGIHKRHPVTNYVTE